MGGPHPSDVGGAERFLLFLAVCPAWFSFLGSLFINQVGGGGWGWGLRREAVLMRR